MGSPIPQRQDSVLSWGTLGIATLILAFLIADPASAFGRWGVADPDDAMRLTQVMDFMQGQAWHDVQQHRFIDGETHWARLADLPLAAVAAIFHIFLPLRPALMAASLVLPLLLLGGLGFPLVAALTRRLAGKKLVPLGIALVFFSPYLLFQFTPSRVDHHAFQILIAGFGLWGLFVLLDRKVRDTPFLTYGLPFALGLSQAAGVWIGTEAVPFVALFSIVLGAAVVDQPNQLKKPARVYAFSISILCLFFWPLACLQFFGTSSSISWFSLTTVAFAGLSACSVAGASLLDKKIAKSIRFALWGGLGLLLGAFFFWLFPHALQGPYADMDPAGRTLILDTVSEAQPIMRKMRFSGHGTALFFHAVAVPLALLVYSAWKSLGGEKGWRHRAAFAYLAVSFLASLFWQARVMPFAQLVMIPIACAAVTDASLGLKDRVKPRVRFMGEIAVIAVLSVVPVMIAPALLTGQSKSLAAFFKPFERPRPALAKGDPVLETLNDPTDFAQKPRRIMSPMDLGPDLLFATPHAVFAAPYKAPHNPDVYALYSERDMDKAFALVKELKVDAFLTPRRIAPAYAGLQTRSQIIGAAVKTGVDGSLYLETDRDHPTLLERILRNQPPRWLKNIEMDGQNEYVLSRVLLSD